jgi:hypothetical protein
MCPCPVLAGYGFLIFWHWIRNKSRWRFLERSTGYGSRYYKKVCAGGCPHVQGTVTFHEGRCLLITWPGVLCWAVQFQCAGESLQTSGPP